MGKKLWTILWEGLGRHWVPIVTVLVVGIASWAIQPPASGTGHLGKGSTLKVHPLSSITHPASRGEKTVAPTKKFVPVPQGLPTQAWIDPVRGQVSLPFGWGYSPTYADWRFHDGLDIKAPAGATVLAAIGGTVETVSKDQLLGEEVRVTTMNGFQTVYAELGSAAVTVGEKVAVGQVIGTVGEPTGAEVGESSHLHFQVEKGNLPADPVIYLPPLF